MASDSSTELERIVTQKNHENGRETPVPGNWMLIPDSTPGCPSGLECLTPLDQLIINQVVEVIEEETGFESKNQYKIRNRLGQDVYYAVEESTCVIRQCCGKSRPFELGIYDQSNKEVIRLIRPYRCESSFCFCCLQLLEVQSPPGTTVGWVKQNCSFLSPCFSLKDENGVVVNKVKGPCFSCQWCDVEFQVFSADQSENIGAITKQWSGLSKEYFTDADNFGITFPMDLDVKNKALMVGAVFLIDFMYFEQ